MIEVEERFFEVFGIGTPTIKCVEWDNGMFSHYDDWYYINRTFEELGIKMNINKLNALIEECKKDDPKNIKHDGYCFSNGCFVNAFITYPQITSDILLELICVLNSYALNISDYLVAENVEKLKDEILETCIELRKMLTFQSKLDTKVQSLFTGVGESIHNGDEKLNKTLQEIKNIAENEIKELTDSAVNGGRYLEILTLIKKAEEK